jgi:thiosulfate dehydrogenase [quinone] large subunit
MFNGVGAFAATTAEHLAKSPLPHRFVLGFGYVIPIVEAILGIALIFGAFTRVALLVASVFMMMLTVGVTANQQWDVAGQQLLYSLILFVLLYLYEHNVLAMDRLR